MRKVPNGREVTLGLIKAFLDSAEVHPRVYGSHYITTPVSTIAQIAATPNYLSDKRLHEVAKQCQHALFDTASPLDDIELCYRIEKRFNWPRGTIHRFVYGTPRKAAAQ